MSSHVNALGLSTHDIVEASTKGTSLGVHYAGVIGLAIGSPERDMVLDQACTAILSGATLTGKDTNKKVLGHATVRMMLRGPLFLFPDTLTLLGHAFFQGRFLSGIGSLRDSASSGVARFCTCGRTSAATCFYDLCMLEWFWGGWTRHWGFGYSRHV